MALEAKVTDEERQMEHLRSQLQWTEEQLQITNAKAEEFKSELEKLQSTYQGKGISNLGSLGVLFDIGWSETGFLNRTFRVSIFKK